MKDNFDKDNLEKGWLFWKLNLSENIYNYRDKIKNIYTDILELPKRWYPIIFASWMVWFALWCTLLIWIPWTTIVFIYWWVKFIDYIDEKITPESKKFLEKIKKILNIDFS